jgi:hypothetical protein
LGNGLEALLGLSWLSDSGDDDSKWTSGLTGSAAVVEGTYEIIAVVKAEVKSLLVGMELLFSLWLRASCVEDIFSLTLHFEASHEVCVMFIWGAWSTWHYYELYQHSDELFTV